MILTSILSKTLLDRGADLETSTKETKIASLTARSMRQRSTKRRDFQRFSSEPSLAGARQCDLLPCIRKPVSVLETSI
jgi:hypothetical protein